MKNILFLLTFISSIAGAQDSTKRTGKWSDPLTWAKKKVPGKGADVVILPKHTVTLDTSVTVGELTVEKSGVLSFITTKPLTLKLSGNLIQRGRVTGKIPAAIYDTVQFIDVNEFLFVGGGMDVMENDIGWWVRDDASFELAGANKTSWTRLKAGAKKGALKLELSIKPTGWKAGDLLSIAPTEKIDTTKPKGERWYETFDEVRVVAVSGYAVTLDRPLQFDHPANSFNGKTYTAEVLNLTRNIVVMGTDSGRAHINFGMINRKVNISNIQIRYMAPRSDGDVVKGRYGLHFHMNGEATRGSLISGVVAMDCGGPAFVPHDSHGMTFKNCIAYNNYGNNFWWDPPISISDTTNDSHNTIFDSCVGAKSIPDRQNAGYRLANFFLGSGRGNVIKNCVAVGNGGAAGAAGFLWPESSNFTDNVWTFENNLSHNHKTDGIFTWQNDPGNHIIRNFTAYNCLNGIEHGAYVNAYKYTDVTSFQNKYGIYLHSLPIKTGLPGPGGSIVEFTRVKSADPLFIAPHTLPGSGSTLFKDCVFPKVIVSELPRRTTVAPGLFDFIGCKLTREMFEIIGMEEGSSILVVDGETLFEVK